MRILLSAVFLFCMGGCATYSVSVGNPVWNITEEPVHIDMREPRLTRTSNSDKRWAPPYTEQEFRFYKGDECRWLFYQTDRRITIQLPSAENRVFCVTDTGLVVFHKNEQELRRIYSNEALVRIISDPIVMSTHAQSGELTYYPWTPFPDTGRWWEF